jgi:hypothetical protein
MSRDFVDAAGERWTAFGYQILHPRRRMRLLFERVRGGTRPREISNVPGELTDLTDEQLMQLLEQAEAVDA